MKSYELWIDGHWQNAMEQRELRAPFDGRVLAQVAQASGQQLEKAMAAAAAAFAVSKKLSRYTRARLLSAMSAGIEKHRAEFVDILVHEAGKPRTLADVEVSRAVGTFARAAEECKLSEGALLPVDTDAAGRAYANAQSWHVPRGPVLAITPFNFPLNLVAHKVAPALAVGAPLLLKPPPQAPGAGVLLAKIFSEVAPLVNDVRERVPLAMFQVLSASNEVMSAALADKRLAILSFTGSDRAGYMLQGKAVGKRVLLELGGNAALIVHKDADVARAAARCAYGAYAYAGQICISVQRILVQQDVRERFETLLLQEINKLKCGDPNDKDVTVGPLIDAASVERVQSWVQEAVKNGAKVLTPWKKEGSVIFPQLLTNVKDGEKLCCEEVFGPVAVLESYVSFGDAVARTNASRFGLQAGVFTESLKIARQAAEELEVGGVLINEVPTFRADGAPYGGMKDSGMGREGVRYAMADYCEYKTLVHWAG